jgi:hypothetical protein
MTETKLSDEQDIIWLEDVSHFPYLRESVFQAPRRTGKPKPYGLEEGGRIVGYAELKPEARTTEPHVYGRRTWWLKDHDPYQGGPYEAVATESVAVGTPSKTWPDGRTTWGFGCSFGRVRAMVVRRMCCLRVR